MSTQNKDDPSVLVREGDATSSLSRRNFIGATAVAVGGLLTGGAALADERAAKQAPAAAKPSGLEKRTQVEALASYVKLYGDGARLDLIGRPGSFRYAHAVRRCAEELGVGDLVTMTGDLDDRAVGGYYRSADVFVSASVHEGFCVPILEAMYHGVPVVALAAAAVPETVAGAGLLVDRSDPAVVATAVHNVVCDEDLRERLVDAGRARAAELSLERSRATMRRVLERWIEAGAQ